MHLNQYVDFANANPTASTKWSENPFSLEGWTYATDGRTIIRTPGIEEGVKPLEATEVFNRKPKVVEVFDWFTSPAGVLTPFSSLTLEPVLVREAIVAAPIDWENPPLNEVEERFTAVPTLLGIHSRVFDQKRLLYIRQTLPAPQFYDEVLADALAPLRFIFDGGGQGALMPMSATMKGNLHWNGARYFPR